MNESRMPRCEGCGEALPEGLALGAAEVARRQAAEAADDDAARARRRPRRTPGRDGGAFPDLVDGSGDDKLGGSDSSDPG